MCSCFGMPVSCLEPCNAHRCDRSVCGFRLLGPFLRLLILCGGSAALRSRSECQLLQDPAVGVVDDRVAQRGEVDLRGPFGGVAQGRADDRKRDVAVARLGGPAVAGSVGGEGRGRVQQGGEASEPPVVVVEGREVLRIGRRGVGGGQDREDVGRVGGRRTVAVENRPDAGFDADRDRLSGFAAEVADAVAPEVGFAQVGDVHEGHAARAEAEKKEVAREAQGAAGRQVEFAEPRHEVAADGPFAGAVHARVDVAERVGLLDQAQRHGPVVGGAQVAHVERHRVPRHAPGDEVGVVVGHRLLGQRRERQLLAVQKAREARGAAGVVACRAVVFAAAQLLDPEAEELEEGRRCGA